MLNFMLVATLCWFRYDSFKTLVTKSVNSLFFCHHSDCQNVKNRSPIFEFSHQDLKAVTNIDAALKLYEEILPLKVLI